MVNKTEIGSVLQYIEQNWPDCTMKNPFDSKKSLALPFPYTAPCITGMFKELFYWDVYFSNIGLLEIGLDDMAKANVDNLFFEIEKLGFAPNSSELINRSQPPYLTSMVKDIYLLYQDKEWLLRAYDLIKKEYYDFWMKERLTCCGLNRHFHNASKDYLLDFYEEISLRIPFSAKSDLEKLQISEHYLAEAETGWDFNPRFNGRCADFIPIDLNANLYMYETDMAYFSNILMIGESDMWLEVARKRKELVDRYCWDDQQGLYFDYDFINQKKSSVKSLAVFHPLWAGMASAEQAKRVKASLACFEYDFGLVTCQKVEKEQIYQWDYPNGWAPLQLIASVGLQRYGFEEDAKRIQEKYLNVVINNYFQTENLWEKYNVVDGSIQVNDEYEMPTLMDWTAGVFVYFAKSFEH